MGTNAAVPHRGRFPSAHYLQFGNSAYLIDCGEGTQVRLQEYKLKPSRLKAIFISHLHGDHILGLPGLLMSMDLSGRKEGLLLFGPHGLRSFLSEIFRITNTYLGFPVDCRETNTEASEILYENNLLSIRSFPLKHRVPCTGFIFREKQQKYKLLKDKLPKGMKPADFKALQSGQDITVEGTLYANAELTAVPKALRSYAYCSDTAYFPELAVEVNNVDLLYHEATFLEEQKDLALKTEHSTALEAARTAKAAQVKKLLIGHFSSRYKNPEALADEARQIFLNTEAAREGVSYEI